MQALSFNYRGISLTDGAYQSNTSMCERCHHPACSDFAATHCKTFTPAFKFKPPLRGFDFPIFNTFRLGLAWSKRLEVGSLVALVDSKTNVAFAHAKVVSVHVGEKHAMAEQHGKFNHTMQALNVTDNIAETMLKRLKSTSGSMIYNNTDKATVIYLERIDGEKENLATG